VLFIACTGFVLGFLGSIPIAGPISVLVLALGLRSGFRKALAVATGGALAEGFYAFLAFWGFSSFLARYANALNASRGITALILFAVGLILIRKRRPVEASVPVTRNAARNGFLIGFTISILNPTLILTWMAASSAVFSAHLVSFYAYEAVPFSLGVMAGIIGWFALLLGLAARYRGRFRPASLDRVIHLTGWLVIAGALVFLMLQIMDLLSA
jgi:threonine/homoserine/homoserine lactone efflux protein